jgi:hypothetical protein
MDLPVVGRSTVGSGTVQEFETSEKDDDKNRGDWL